MDCSGPVQPRKSPRGGIRETKQLPTSLSFLLGMQKKKRRKKKQQQKPQSQQQNPTGSTLFSILHIRQGGFLRAPQSYLLRIWHTPLGSSPPNPGCTSHLLPILCELKGTWVVKQLILLKPKLNRCACLRTASPKPRRHERSICSHKCPGLGWGRKGTSFTESQSSCRY